jgi:class 3 adenylate cyclase
MITGIAIKDDIIEIMSNEYIHKMHIDNQPNESVKKITVLFTDIVGSTKYFKTHGDLAGRLMLRRHHDVTAKIIHEFRGSVIKSLGDSIMAYFVDPKHALKSAINIQQDYSAFNQIRDVSEQVHIRISVHFGYGILEEDDIYGDVVNVTAKLTSLAEADQIYISQEVYDTINDLPQLQFELIDLSKRRNVPDGLIVYRVTWDETARFGPIMTTILYVKPIWELAGDSFKTAWHNLVNKKNNLWQEKTETEEILSDRTIILIMKEDKSVLDIAEGIMSYLRENCKDEKATSFLPVYIIIDSGFYLKADKLDLQALHVSWEEIEADEIYISTAAYDRLKTQCISLSSSAVDINESSSFFKLDLKSEQEVEKSSPLPCHDALINGENPPCYYCGSKGHTLGSCPSKRLPEITNAINRIGYRSLEEINRIYSKYLTGFNSSFEERHDDSNNGDLLLAHQVFYDLKRIFQIRFFRTIWGAKEKAWDNVRGRMCEGNRSGIMWVAQDCIRVSNLSKAESLLENSLIRNLNDYKVYCTMGFLNIERSNIPLAEHYFSEALNYAETDPEKIFLLFLLFRIYELNNNLGKASAKIRDIMEINPNCADAIYLDIVLQFRQGGTNEPLRKLINLIHQNREYYIYALIDPDLKEFRDIIDPKLKELLNNTRNNARRVIRENEAELKKWEEMFTSGEKTLKKAKESWGEINRLTETDSYFGYLDVIYSGISITKTVHRTIEEDKKELYEGFLKLKHRLRIYLKFTSAYPYKDLIEQINTELVIIQQKVNESWRKLETSPPDELIKTFKNKQLISQELDQIEQKMKKFATIQWVGQFVAKFLKRNLIFITAIFLAAFILLPIVIFYTNLVLIKFDISPIYQIWLYQKMISVIGCVCSIVISFLITYMDVPKRDFQIQ